MSTSLQIPPRDRVARRPSALLPGPETASRLIWKEQVRLASAIPGPGARRRVAPHVIRWLVGLVIASLLVGAVGPHFLSSLRVYEWSSELNDYTIRPGYVHRNRDEGWSRTHYGAFGLHNAAGLEIFTGPTILIWGDSYVEAHQVNDDQKMDHHVNLALVQRQGDPLRAVAIGRAYWSVADYYFNIPRYERLFRPECHFIVLAEHGLKDLCPDAETFLAEPRYEFVARREVDTGKSQVIADLQRYGLADAVLAPWKAVRTVLKDVRGARFRLGPVVSPEPTSPFEGDAILFGAETPDHLEESWAYAVDRLTSVTDTPIVFVLVPEIPYLEHGRVRLEDPQARWRAKLRKLLADKQIGCIDMTRTLIDDYRATGQFSRGFHRGRPGRGHLNARGHALVAQEITAYLDRCTRCN